MFEKALETAKRNKTGDGRYLRLVARTDGRVQDVNMSTVYTRLIQAAGRWCEEYASDLLYDIKSIDAAVKSGKNTIVPVGFRRLGVDHAEYVKSRLLDTKQDPLPYVYPEHVYPEHVYRKILAVEIENGPAGKVDVSLWDITDDVNSVESIDSYE